MNDLAQTWRPCSTCKKPIGFGARYWTCSVSTCNRKRTGLAFCSVPCWDAHAPLLNHREDAGAVEERAPTREQWRRAQQESESKSTSPPATGEGEKDMSEEQKDLENEILVVASKVKAYIREKSGMNTSANVLARLSDKIRYLCNEAIEHAKDDGRKTVMDRDFK